MLEHVSESLPLTLHDTRSSPRQKNVKRSSYQAHIACSHLVLVLAVGLL